MVGDTNRRCEMPKESETSKKFTRGIKAVDKLVQDLKRDVADIISGAAEVKEVLENLKQHPKPPDDKKDV
jgi:hypothetical protein